MVWSQTGGRSGHTHQKDFFFFLVTVTRRRAYVDLYAYMHIDEYIRVNAYTLYMHMICMAKQCLIERALQNRDLGPREVSLTKQRKQQGFVLRDLRTAVVPAFLPTRHMSQEAFFMMYSKR